MPKPLRAFVALGLLPLAVSCTSSCGAGGSEPAAASAPSPSASPGDLGPFGEVVPRMSDDLWLVHQAKDGTRWFGSDGHGVFRFDGKEFVRYTTRDGLAHDEIRSIQEDAAGNILFNTNGGISKFDGRRFTTLVPLRGAAAADAWRAEPGDLWFMAPPAENGPLRYDGRSLYQLEFPRIPLEAEFRAKFPSVPYSPYCVYSAFRDSRGAMWFGTAVFGVCRFDGRAFEWITEDELTELDPGPSFGVRGIVEDREGKFWLSGLDDRYDARPARAPGAAAPELWYRKESGVLGPDGPGQPFMSGLRDRRGDVWVATYGSGVWKVDGERVTRFPVAVGGEMVTLYSISEDREGVLWVGSHKAGAWRLVGERFERFGG